MEEKVQELEKKWIVIQDIALKQLSPGINIMHHVKAV